MELTICFAISTRRMIRFSYDGGVRTVEPYCHGVSTAGNEVLRAYQVGGFSQSEDPTGWRLFDLAKMEDVEITGEKFEPYRPEYNPGDQVMRSVLCCV